MQVEDGLLLAVPVVIFIVVSVVVVSIYVAIGILSNVCCTHA